MWFYRVAGKYRYTLFILKIVGILFSYQKIADLIFSRHLSRLGSPVLWGNGAQNSARGADGHYIGRNVLVDQASGADDGISADCDAGQYDTVCAQPDIFFNVYG